MNAVIEKKLKDWWQESLNQNALAVHAVAHLLLANYQNGTQGDFAKWCCQYMLGLKMETSIDGGQEVLPGELPLRTAIEGDQESLLGKFSNDPNGKDWIC